MTDRSIIVGVDGTSTGLRAVAWAAEEALLRRRPLRLVHAAPYLGTPDDPTGRGRADAVLTRARTVAHQIAPELSTDVAVLPDPPVAALIDASADAELLVIGMIGGSGPEIVLGSVTLDITTGAHCPVAVVRGESAADHVTRRRPPPVLLGIESVDADAAAVTAAFDDADRHGSGLTVVHVPSHPGHLGLAASAVSDRLAPWRSEHPGVEVTVRIGQGNPGLALLHESADARHIVLGTRGRHAAVRAVLGSVSRFVLRHSRVPVTIVPRSLSSRTTVPAALAGDPHDRSQLW
jgi:nucleotide-binding universal stress UspA family protein